MSDKQNGNSVNNIADFPGGKGSETNIFENIADFFKGMQPNEISGRISLKSYLNQYLSAWPEGKVDWSRTWDREWEQFKLEYRGGNKIALKSCHGSYLSAKDEVGGTVQCDQYKAGEHETWTVEKAGAGIALKSYLGKYLHPKKDGRVTATHDEVTEKETFAVTYHDGEAK
jgi:hypothetical protein